MKLVWFFLERLISHWSLTHLTCLDLKYNLQLNVEVFTAWPNTSLSEFVAFQ